jgi:DNA-binding response OmpR family regulator
MKVLLVEDEVHLASTLRHGLIEQGHAVDVVHTGPDGLRAMREHAYDVVVLDIMLPGLSGYEVCRQLRRDGVWTPVLMLTAKDGEFDEADAFDLGADDYLTKPFSLVVLGARLRALLRRTGPERPVDLVCGELVLNPGRRSVTCRGTPLALTRKEYAVLEFFMRHGDAVVSRTQILNGVWDSSYSGDSNVVEVYVGYLRRKLAGCGITIETLRGLGYRLTVG